MNLNEIINYKPPRENYYDILGCDQSSSIEQINKEYRIKALQFHPDKNPEKEAQEKFTLLQDAKNVLTNEASRRSYDQWLSSGLCISFEQWQSRRTHPMMHWATPKPGHPKIQAQIPQGQGSECNNKSNDHQDNSQSGSERASLDGK